MTYYIDMCFPLTVILFVNGELFHGIRPHMALNGKTPAEMARINLQLGQNKWESRIRQSSRHNKSIKTTL